MKKLIITLFLVAQSAFAKGICPTLFPSGTATPNAEMGAMVLWEQHQQTQPTNSQAVSEQVADATQDSRPEDLKQILKRWKDIAATLKEIDSLGKLEGFIDRVRRDNGEDSRSSDSEQDRKVRQLHEFIADGEISPAVGLLRETFRSVEFGLHLIRRLEKEIQVTIENMQNGTLDQRQGMSIVWDAHNKLEKAQDKFGVNYGLYRRTRAILEDLSSEKRITPEALAKLDDKTKAKAIAIHATAEKIYENLGANNILSLFRDLGIRASGRPSIEQIKRFYRTHPRALFAYLRQVRNIELISLGKDLGALSVDTIQDVIDKIPVGTRLRDFIRDFNEISSDARRMRKYGDKIQNLFDMDDDSNGIRDMAEFDYAGKRAIIHRIAEYNSGTKNEFLKTFARMINYTDHFQELKRFLNEELVGKGVLYPGLAKQFDDADAYGAKSEALKDDDTKIRAKILRLVVKYVTLWGVTEGVTSIDWSRIPTETAETTNTILQWINNLF